MSLYKNRQGIRTSTLCNNEELIFKNTLNFPSLEGKQQVSDIKQFEIRPAVFVDEECCQSATSSFTGVRLSKQGASEQMAKKEALKL